MSGCLPCSTFSLSHAWIPELEVLVDSKKEFTTELSTFRDPFMVGRDRNWTKSGLELHIHSCEKGIRSTNISSS